jgi:ribonuclease Z
MLPFSVTILGNGSAVPTSFQKPTAQLVQYNGKKFLVDCGEGTQMQMIRYNTGHKHLDHIFISHLHGDHYFGLIGLINTFHLFGREKPLTVYGPKKLKRIMDVQLEAAGTVLRYPLKYVFTDEVKGVIYEDKHLTVEHFPLKHRITTYGFVFREKPKEKNLRKEFVERYHPSVEQIHRVKQGEDYFSDTGERLPNRKITLEPPPLRSYAFCSDTAYTENILPFIKGVTLLYHEATFTAGEQWLADEKYHSTSVDAAKIALKAKVNKLLLGHYSARLKDRSQLLEEAQEVFKNTILSEEGATYDIY